jgi:hypothetical protein
MSSEAAVRKTSLQNLEREFAELLSALTTFVRAVPDEMIYRVPIAGTVATVGETVVKSAAILEQTFGGLTSNLWDDPFEWTLPETLASGALIVQYLDEVDAARRRAFAFLADDSALTKRVSVPSSDGQISVLDLLERTLLRAASYQNEAAKILKTFS